MNSSECGRVTNDGENVLLTGATGFVGKHIYRQLCLAGYTVRLFARKNFSGAGGECFIGDITDADACREAMKGVKFFIHAAGEKKDISRFQAVNVEGTRNLLAAAQAEGVKSYVHISSVGVIGADPFQEKVFSEEERCNPSNSYEISKRKAEELVIEACSHGFPGTILRPSNVFGDDDPEHGLLTLVRAVGRGYFAFLGGRDVTCNYVYVEDVAHAVLAVMEDPKASGRTYHISDDCLLREFVEAIAEELGVKKKVWGLPEFVAAYERKALRFGYRSKWLRKSSVIARLISLNNHVRFKSNRLHNEMDFVCPIGWRRGLSRLIKWYQAAELL